MCMLGTIPELSLFLSFCCRATVRLAVGAVGLVAVPGELRPGATVAHAARHAELAVPLVARFGHGLVVLCLRSLPCLLPLRLHEARDARAAFAFGLTLTFGLT